VIFSSSLLCEEGKWSFFYSFKRGGKKGEGSFYFTGGEKRKKTRMVFHRGKENEQSFSCFEKKRRKGEKARGKIIDYWGGREIEKRESLRKGVM